MALLIQGESLIMFWGDITILLWLVTLGLATLGDLAGTVRVSTLPPRRTAWAGEIHVLNLKWGWRVFRNAVFPVKRGETSQIGIVLHYQIIYLPKTLKKLSCADLDHHCHGSGVLVGSLLVSQYSVSSGMFSKTLANHVRIMA